MWPRLSRSEFKATGRPERKARFREVVERGPPPGLIAYLGGTAVGWVSVAPRSGVARFDAGKLSRLETPEEGVFAITCFYVRAGHRRRGLSERLLGAAVDYARARGAVAIDACALEAEGKLTGDHGFVGLAEVYRRAGFVEIARRSPRRPLMRIRLQGSCV